MEGLRCRLPPPLRLPLAPPAKPLNPGGALWQGALLDYSQWPLFGPDRDQAPTIPPTTDPCRLPPKTLALSPL